MHFPSVHTTQGRRPFRFSTSHLLKIEEAEPLNEFIAIFCDCEAHAWKRMCIIYPTVVIHKVIFISLQTSVQTLKSTCAMRKCLRCPPTKDFWSWWNVPWLRKGYKRQTLLLSVKLCGKMNCCSKQFSCLLSEILSCSMFPWRLSSIILHSRRCSCFLRYLLDKKPLMSALKPTSTKTNTCWGNDSEQLPVWQMIRRHEPCCTSVLTVRCFMCCVFLICR